MFSYYYGKRKGIQKTMPHLRTVASISGIDDGTRSTISRKYYVDDVSSNMNHTPRTRGIDTIELGAMHIENNNHNKIINPNHNNNNNMNHTAGNMTTDVGEADTNANSPYKDTNEDSDISVENMYDAPVIDPFKYTTKDHSDTNDSTPNQVSTQGNTKM